MIWALELDVPIVELDTHLLFRETEATRDRLVERYGLTLIHPHVISIADQHRSQGPNLWETNPDLCCQIRKVDPLIKTLKGFTAWASGVRRTQSPSRASLAKVVFSPKYEVWKLHPLADWSEERVWSYIEANDIPYHPLHDAGYRSIGCMPCTRPTAANEEERAGRWAGSDKLECGLHEADDDPSGDIVSLPYPTLRIDGRS